LLFISVKLFAVEPPSQGFLSLPDSQMPGPFFSFGQNIIGKNVLQFYFASGYQKLTTEQYLDIEPSLIYGISENASIYLIAPVAIDYRDQESHSSGFSDSTIQLEYAFFNSSNAQGYGQATIVGAVSFPTGSYNKSPPTGDGTSSLFLGTTYSFTGVNWYGFVSPGVELASKRHDTLLGTQYLYQLGVAKNIHSVSDHYIFAFMMEIDGEYDQKDKVMGVLDPDSGGNTIFITPSLWYSTKKLILQLGISLPLVQQLNGDQSKNQYFVVGSLGWTF